MQLQHGSTPESIARRSQCFQLSSDMRRDYNKLLDGFEANEDSDTTSHNSKPEKWKTDVSQAVKVLLEINAFENKGNRAHAGFPSFTYENFHINNSFAYKTKIAKLCQFADNIDRYRSVCTGEIAANADTRD
jgi:hypothetical protein